MARNLMGAAAFWESGGVWGGGGVLTKKGGCFTQKSRTTQVFCFRAPLKVQLVLGKSQPGDAEGGGGVEDSPPSKGVTV